MAGRPRVAISVEMAMLVVCPVCGAKRYARCWRVKSWVVPRIPMRGFFTAHTVVPHPERRKAAQTVESATDPRTDLRERVRSMGRRKLSGVERPPLSRWASSPGRTQEELAAKVAELEAMADLPW